MPDQVVLFLFGVFIIMALRWLFAKVYPRGRFVGLDLMVFWFLGAAFMALGAWLVLGVLEQHYAFGTWRFVYWIVLGRGDVVLAGCIAGFVIDATLSNSSILTVDYKTAGLFLGGSGIALVAIFIVTVPGAVRHLGFSDLKAGGVEIAIIRASASPQATGGSFFSVSSTLPSSGYSPWFNNVWDMFREDPASNNKINRSFSCAGATQSHDSATHSAPAVVFQKRPYFYREASYLNLVDGTSVPCDLSDELNEDMSAGLAGAFWRQVFLIGYFRPAVACAGYYHSTFPALGVPQDFFQPMIENAIGIEHDLEATSRAVRLDPDVLSDLKSRMYRIWKRRNPLLQQAKQTIGKPDQQASASPGGDGGMNPRPGDCDPTRLPNYVSLPGMMKWIAPPNQVLPPYFAMLLANIDGMLGAKDEGLRILNGWQNYYKSYQKSHRNAPAWFGARAALEYGIVQEADESAPTSPVELFYLNYLSDLFDKNSNLAIAIRKFKSCKCPPEETDVGNGIEQSRCPDPRKVGDAVGAAARLRLLYDDVVQRRLFARLATLSSRDGRPLNSRDEEQAQMLISSANDCLAGEAPQWRRYRQAVDRVAGGLLLAEWASQAPGAGLLRSGAVEAVRTDALHSLISAWPLILAEARESRTAEGPTRVLISSWDYNQRIVEQAILDLEAKLAN